MNLLSTFCSVCRIFGSIPRLKRTNEDFQSEMIFEVHSGSLIDYKTLLRELENIIDRKEFNNPNFIFEIKKEI